MTDAGIYFLLIRLDQAFPLSVAGRQAVLPAAWYVYVGSAQRHLAHRIARHCRIRKQRHWHIDHLLRFGRVVSVRVIEGAPRAAEAACADLWLSHADFVPVRKFGATDSPAYAHLAGFRTRRAAEEVPVWKRAAQWPISLSRQRRSARCSPARPARRIQAQAAPPR